ncbi:MAG: hypothetical protein JWP15_2207 [Alphaproteobacteria bacterium]|nr:hypothetical protein [Alphaproteobacteria bacterium]
MTGKLEMNGETMSGRTRAPGSIKRGVGLSHCLFMVISFLSLAALPSMAVPASVKAPRFLADARGLHTPNGWMLGEITAVAVDAHDNVWVLHRPHTIPAVDQARAAPPVLAFDRHGKFLRAFGGPGDGYDWPTVEHSIAVDGRGRVWIAGNFRTPGQPGDDMVLTFSGDGHFLRQIGRRGASTGDADTKDVHAPGDLYVDDAARELYVADGYVNRRVIVFDSESGAFKRMWGAYGTDPPASPAPIPRADGDPFVQGKGEEPSHFDGVHGVRLSRDHLVYVSDRNNQRIQVFTRGGEYLRQVFVDRNMPSGTTASGIAFSPDLGQRYLYVADFGNARVVVLERATLRLVKTIGRFGAGPGEFRGPHLLATDSHGTLYVAEVQGRRVQRLVPVNGRAPITDKVAE